MTNPVHKSGYLKSNHFEKGGFSFEVIETDYGKCRSVWFAVDTLRWFDKNGNKQITRLTRRKLMEKFNNE